MSIIIDTEEFIDADSKIKKIIIPFDDFNKLLGLLKSHSIEISNKSNDEYNKQALNKRTFGSARGNYQLSNDFDEPINDFEELTCSPFFKQQK